MSKTKTDKPIDSTKGDLSLSKPRGCPQIREGPDASACLSNVDVGLSDRTEAVIRGVQMVMSHHGASNGLLLQLKTQLHTYLDTSNSESVWLKRTKYALTYPLAKYLKNDLPPAPDVAWRPSGALRNWMKARLVAFNRKNTHLWYSWLQAKRCALPVSSEMISEAYKKHFDQLTRPDPCQEGTVGSYELDKIFNNPVFRKLLAQIRKSVGREYENDFADRTPSTSACFEETRNGGGQYGALRNYLENINPATVDWDHPKLNEQLKEYPSNGARQGIVNPWLGGDELVRMYHCTTVRRNNVLYGTVVSQYQSSGRYRWKMLEHYDEIRLELVDAELCATIQAVLEPLKIRIISKGPAFEYYRMKPLQKTIHSVLRRMPCFRLIGRPMCPTDLLDLIPEILREDDEWISVDYSAATDGLSAEYGQRILHEILGDLPPEEVVRASKVLGAHKLFYPVWNEKKGKWGTPEFRGVQTNGQLMGGILSFPILCLANLGVYLHVKRSTDSGDLTKVLVNGDDMLYVGSKRDWIRHIKVAGRVGLEMSVGKAYRHPVYANANSTSFHCDLRAPRVLHDVVHDGTDFVPIYRGGPCPWQINYFNAGLFFGQHKVQNKEAGTAASHHDDSESCLANVNTILQGTLPGRQAEILQLFLQQNSERIQTESLSILRRGRKTTLHHRNLFLPIDQGGMGVEAPTGWKFFVKSIDRRLSSSLDLPYLDCRPIRGYELEKQVEEIPPWVRKVSEFSIPEFCLSSGKTRSISVVPRIPAWCNPSALLY